MECPAYHRRTAQNILAICVIPIAGIHGKDGRNTTAKTVQAAVNFVIVLENAAMIAKQDVKRIRLTGCFSRIN